MFFLAFFPLTGGKKKWFMNFVFSFEKSRERKIYEWVLNNCNAHDSLNKSTKNTGLILIQVSHFLFTIVGRV